MPLWALKREGFFDGRWYTPLHKKGIMKTQNKPMETTVLHLACFFAKRIQAFVCTCFRECDSSKRVKMQKEKTKQRLQKRKTIKSWKIFKIVFLFLQPMWELLDTNCVTTPSGFQWWNAWTKKLKRFCINFWAIILKALVRIGSILIINQFAKIILL